MGKSQLTWRTKLNFGIGALGKDLCYAIISFFLMIYLTDTVGLSPLFVGNLFLAARVWDAINDPLMGFLVDNTRTRWGKFRPWILIGSVANAIVLVFLFRKPEGLEGTGLYVYFSIMYILWGMTYTLMDIPYWSMLPSLSKTKEERDQMSVIPRIFASTAWLLMSAFAIKSVNVLGKGNDLKGYAKLAIGIAVVFVLTELITVIFVKDRSSEEAENVENKEKKQKTSIKDALHIITANDQLKIYVGVVLCYNLLVQVAGCVSTYYFKYVAGEYELYSVFTTAAQFAEIAALFAFPILSKKLSKKQVFAIASFSPAVGLLGLVISGLFVAKNIPVIAICGVFYKFGSGLTLGATTVMLADIIDYGEYKLGTRNESIIASFQTLLVKTASAVAAWLVGVGLTLVGYVANAEQSASTIMGMRVIMGVIPAIVTILAFIIYKNGYKLDGEFLQKVLSSVNGNKKEERM